LIIVEPILKNLDCLRARSARRQNRPFSARAAGADKGKEKSFLKF